MSRRWGCALRLASMALGSGLWLGCTETGVAASSGEPSQGTSGSAAGADGGPGCEPLDGPAPDGGCMIPPGADAGLIAGASCNPVTGEPCFVDGGAACGDAVDARGSVVGFECYPPPNEVPACAACDYDQHAFCVAGATCIAGKCLRYCCSAEDCTGAACIKATNTGAPLFESAPNLGVCSSH